MNEIVELESATLAAKQLDTIHAINKDAVHRICSGQVVLTLAIAVKELVENAIDAGATNIEVRIKDYGMELIEVIDNGTGVIKENFAALTLKHYTSKIREFSDLETVCTLGFRGEALSSLCSLANLSIMTRHKSAEYGTKIIYDQNGVINSETPCARPIGTTVSLTNLFVPLPVRRKEFVKNHKREFNKMCNLLYAYCLVSKDIKIACTNTTTKGAKSLVVSTQPLHSIKDNIVSVFGSKQVSNLIEIDLIQPDELIAQEYNLKNIPVGAFKFDFFVSSVVHGSGRSAQDRQFYFINSRPCEPTKIMKLVNEIYRQFNSNQYPFVYLNILLESSGVDVNVTPDKRQIYLEQEKLLLATVKATLLDAFKTFPSTYKLQNNTIANNSMDESRGSKRMNDSSISLFDSFIKKHKKSDEQDIKIKCIDKVKTTKQMDLNCYRMGSKKLNDSLNMLANEVDKELTLLASPEKNLNEAPIEININTKGKLIKIDESNNEVSLLESPEKNLNEAPIEININTKGKLIKIDESNNEVSLLESPEKNLNEASIKININTDRKLINIDESNNEVSLLESPEKNQVPNEVMDDTKTEEAIECKLIKIDKQAKSDKLIIIDEKSKDFKSSRKSIEIKTSIDEIRDAMKNINVEDSKEIVVKFRSIITPSTNEKAEKELQKQISKDMFSKMDIVGQFNYAFIVTCLDEDLFIIDQHATDEKYNFEELQKNTVLDSQMLVNPKDLELTTGQENILIEHESIFKKNGFFFKIDENAAATKKVKLIKIPVSKNYLFGKDDIDEMLYMLQEGCTTNCRPSRVRGMFASRACRKSVMVGKPLKKSDMRRLVDHMGEIDQPWNCPHGRPTMRHLVNLGLLQNK